MSNFNKYIPTIGTSGNYKLSEPFDAFISSSESYTLKSVRKISECLSLGEDILGNIYAANNIADKYESDAKEDIEILSLQSDKGNWVRVPVTYLKCYPTVNGIPFRTVSLVIPIQPLPTDTDFGLIKQRLSDVIKAEFGFPVNVRIVETSKTVLVSETTADSVNIERYERKNEYSADAQLLHVTNDLAIALDKVHALEDYIKSRPD